VSVRLIVDDLEGDVERPELADASPLVNGSTPLVQVEPRRR
jgi:hypothetical protein